MGLISFNDEGVVTEADDGLTIEVLFEGGRLRGGPEHHLRRVERPASTGARTHSATRINCLVKGWVGSNAIDVEPFNVRKGDVW